MKRLVAVLVLVGGSAVGGALLGAQQPAGVPQTALDPRVLEWDKGPEKIDVSKYPPEMKQKYRIFERTCSKCHTLARPINAEFVLEDEWERYIKMMMRRAGREGNVAITPADAMQIWEFLVFDSKTRKKDLYDRRTAQRRP